jgi:dTDP-glucose 4,6-dehydratase
MNKPLSAPSVWNGRTVFVTGATGFLGGWLVGRLLDYGANVVALVRRDRAESQFELAGYAARCHIVRGEAWDPALISEVFKAYPLAAIFHTAASADVNQALADPLDNFRSAIDSTMLLLEQVRLHQPDCAVVVSSSDKAYGPQPTPFSESAALRPHHPYEVAKATQDLMAQSYGRVFGLPVAVTRCANYFGGWDFNWRRIIPGTIRALLLGEPVILRGDGRFTRDFLYVDDAVDIQLMLAERLLVDASIRGEPFNFSLEVDFEILDLVKRIGRLMGIDVNPRLNAEAKAEIPLMRVSCDKARAQLGWRPAHDLDSALQATIDWYRDYFARAR